MCGGWAQIHKVASLFLIPDCLGPFLSQDTLLCCDVYCHSVVQMPVSDS